MFRWNASLAAMVLFCVATHASSADFPSKPVRLVIGNAPGSVIDVVGRIFAPKLGERLRQQVVVDNRPGGLELIAVNAMLQSEPDGHTLMWSSVGYPAMPVMLKTIPFDILKDVAPISMVAYTRLVLISSLKAPFNTLDDMVTYAKANPRKLNLAVGGAGGAVLIALWLNSGTGGNYELIRYSGSPQATQAILTGESDLFVQAIGAVRQAADSGKLRFLGFTGVERSSSLPNVPAFGEAASPELRELAKKGFGISWFGVLAPAKVPQTTLSIITEQTIEVAKDPEFAKQIQKFDFVAAGTRPNAFAQQIANEAETWKSLSGSITPQ